MEYSDTEGQKVLRRKADTAAPIKKCKHIETMEEVLARSIAKSDRPDVQSTANGVIERPTLESITKPMSKVSAAPIKKNAEGLRESVNQDWEDFKRYMGMTKTFIF